MGIEKMKKTCLLHKCSKIINYKNNSKAYFLLKKLKCIFFCCYSNAYSATKNMQKYASEILL